MERRCRVCAATEETKPFRNLFDNRSNFAEKLFYVASITVSWIFNIKIN